MAKKSEPSGGNINDIKKNKKNKKTGPNAMAMKSKAAKPNPFESIWSRRKFDFLGKKGKGEERRMGLVRSAAVEKRKNTLLREYEQNAKASVFVDKRIGEHNDTLGEYDKAMMRSQRQYQIKLKKKSQYNLSDGEEDEFGIEGFGSFSGKDDFEEEVTFEDEETIETKRKRANESTTDASEDEQQRPKTKKEVMSEIIAKSKHFKAQKAMAKEESEKLTSELDKNFTSMLQSQALLSLTQPKATNLPDLQQEKSDPYDKLVREMIMEARARPSERTKTLEEVDEEEKERLERMEEERQKRMQAKEDSSDEEDASAEDAVLKPRPISGDDLGDSFSIDEPQQKLNWIEEIRARKDEEEKDEDGSTSEESGDDEDDDDEESEDGEKHDNAESLKDWEQSDDDNPDTDSEDNAGIDEESEMKSNEMPSKPKKIKDLKPHAEELPFVIEAPSSFQELAELFDTLTDDQIVEAISRIRKTNAISLAAENRKKIQVFYGVLLQYFAVLANKKPLNLNLINLLVKPLIEMSMQIPYFAAICARQRLLRTRTQFCEDIKQSEKGCWPSLKTLFLVRLWSMVFPCSDFRHVVMTPTLLLICEYLMRCRITGGQDVAIGSFLCSMVLLITKQSRKFCPEAITFLQTLLQTARKENPSPSGDSHLYDLLEIKTHRPLLCIEGQVEQISPLDFLSVVDMPEDSPFFNSDNFRASMLFSVSETVLGFVHVYEGFSSFPELFSPIRESLVNLVGQKHMPDSLQEKFKDIAHIIEKKIEEHYVIRRPLQLLKQKPVPIKLVNPKFEEDYVKGRDYDPDRERSERKKLKKQVKQEQKGAIRELRKDNHFLQGVKDREKALAKEEMAEKYGKARAFLQEQEHAFKSGQLGNSGKKRRK
ncbi:nucleolar protein 14 [Impatiens glandulifera]|uniref:nucleolar protein 14 n=1 Tax=Impatiens glandulifera TaxID=253017 RepID=UPI001FB0E785|nr:nucleolar protein 14 [Impatiens glandulifera]